MSQLRCKMTNDYDHCFRCGKYIGDGGREWHHVFGGANRQISEKYGLKVPLCHWCHNEPPNGVHFNEEANIELKKLGQLTFEQEHSREEFMKLFGRNYR